MSEWLYMVGTIVGCVAILLAGGWWLNRRTGEKIGEALREQRDVKAREILLGWGDGADPIGSRGEGINPTDDLTDDCINCGGPDDE